DRAAGDQYREVFPEIVDIARASRQFLTRAVRYLASEARSSRNSRSARGTGPAPLSASRRIRASRRRRGVGRGGAPRTPTRPPSQLLVHGERLGQVVLGARLQAADLGRGGGQATQDH